MFEVSYSEFVAIFQVILIDLILAGDNAIVVGMAAAGVAPEYRKKVILYGIGLAVIMRIIFAGITIQLLNIVGLALVGGLLLLWVCWKLYRDLRLEAEAKVALDAGGDASTADVRDSSPKAQKTLRAAVIQVAIADISMSLDNVLAVAGAANNHMTALIIGLAFSVILMGIGATLIARLLQKYQWIGYIGLLLILYVAALMIWRGSHELFVLAGL
ncbi:MAG: YjbE family putative metal transport protein [Alphaproteobacteria bacterium]